MLYYTGTIYKMGEVHEGTTTMDLMHQERERGITITGRGDHLLLERPRINLIDTPGHVDFTAEVERPCACSTGLWSSSTPRRGVEAQSETVWRQADRYGVPRICFINKMDRMGPTSSARSVDPRSPGAPPCCCPDPDRGGGHPRASSTC